LLSYTREIIIAVLCGLLWLQSHLTDKARETVVSQQKTIVELTVREETLNAQIKENEIEYDKRIEEFKNKVQETPKVVTKLQTITIKETGDECNDIKNILDQYRNSII
jgi:hypothetical protein